MVLTYIPNSIGGGSFQIILGIFASIPFSSSIPSFIANSMGSLMNVSTSTIHGATDLFVSGDRLIFFLLGLDGDNGADESIISRLIGTNLFPGLIFFELLVEVLGRVNHLEEVDIVLQTLKKTVSRLSTSRLRGRTETKTYPKLGKPDLDISVQYEINFKKTCFPLKNSYLYQQRNSFKYNTTMHIV
jgi:hypothetical protein